MRPPASGSSNDPKTRVFWSDAEKAKIVAIAADIRSRRPDLAGLPLLRAAIRELPSTRRRKLIAISQAPWFEPGVAIEMKRRESESNAKADLASIMRLNATASTSVAEGQEQFIGLHEEWSRKQDHRLSAIESLLASILEELRKLSGSSAEQRSRSRTYSVGGKKAQSQT